MQGVFYRGSCQTRARELGVTGWVKNRTDGRVEVLAMAENETLDVFEAWLEIGPQWAKVSNIEVQEETIETNDADFAIRATT